MGNLTLVVDRRGANLTLGGHEVACVTYPSGESHRVGLRALQRVVVQGEVQLSATLLRACHEVGIGIVLMPGRGPGASVNLLPHTVRQIGLRHAQHCCFASPAERLATAKVIVSAKIAQQRHWLTAHSLSDHLGRFADEASVAADLSTLLGIEGASSAHYFALWSRLWQSPWHFPGRNRQPPRDPVNALLSLGYTLAQYAVGRWAGLSGLDLALGFLHTPYRDRPALALDLLEPLRPWVDEWALQLLQGGRLLPEHFTFSPSEGCRLDKAGRAVFYAAWHAAEPVWFDPVARQSLAVLLRRLRVHRAQLAEHENLRPVAPGSATP